MSYSKQAGFRREIRSYILRAGRMTQGQQQAMDELYPRYGFNITDFAGGTLDYFRVFGNSHPVAVEVGFGDGEALVEMAVTNPRTNYIGIEVHPPGVGHLLLRIREMEIDNIRLFREDAVAVIRDCVPENSVDLFCMYFPDPWPKKKHHKRRLLQSGFAELLRDRLKPGGRFHFATDWEEYAVHALECLENCRGLQNIAGTDNYSNRPESRPLTKFERRGQKLGHAVFDIIMEKTTSQN